ncbi:TIGR02300 family protein [Methylosinus sp. Sm6]|uniref:TIGR02300 family protein n=1 Tax=Methylosinus sp. Sm6 TaxID=2866948 RepID=UPI001C9A19FE|nr:TIGR02300 family protein [Methylosinus sp. Sm6]
MAKAELGAKRRCLSCGAAFFDLNRDPITCPKCATIFQVVELPRSAPRRAPYRPMQSEARVPDGQPSAEDDEVSAEADEAEADTDADADDAETDDGIPQPIDEDEKIEEIDDLI